MTYWGNDYFDATAMGVIKPEDVIIVTDSEMGEVVGYIVRKHDPKVGVMPELRNEIPGWEGSIGPFPNQYGDPHVYARDIHSGAGNCVCGQHLGHSRHVAAAPGVPIPERETP